MKLKLFVATAIALVFLSGTSLAVYRAYWFEPSEDLLAAEGAGDLIKGETRILDSMETPEGITFQLVTYRTTRHRCFDVTAHSSSRPIGATGGCGYVQRTPLQEKELAIMGRGSLSVQGSLYTTTIGVAGPGVDRIRLTYFGGTSEIRSVHTDLRVWFAVSTPKRTVDLWEPA